MEDPYFIKIGAALMKNPCEKAEGEIVVTFTEKNFSIGLTYQKFADEQNDVEWVVKHNGKEFLCCKRSVSLEQQSRSATKRQLIEFFSDFLNQTANYKEYCADTPCSFNTLYFRMYRLLYKLS